MLSYSPKIKIAQKCQSKRCEFWLSPQLLCQQCLHPHDNNQQANMAIAWIHRVVFSLGYGSILLLRRYTIEGALHQQQTPAINLIFECNSINSAKKAHLKQLSWHNKMLHRLLKENVTSRFPINVYHILHSRQPSQHTPWTLKRYNSINSEHLIDYIECLPIWYGYNNCYNAFVDKDLTWVKKLMNTVLRRYFLVWIQHFLLLCTILVYYGTQQVKLFQCLSMPMVLIDYFTQVSSMSTDKSSS